MGEIGRAIARAVLSRPELELVAAVDPAPALSGRSLADLLDIPGLDLQVGQDLREVLPRMRGGVVLHATGSAFAHVYEQIVSVVEAGVSVVSTCEEMAFPWLKNDELAEKLDKLCESKDVAVLGTGVNPGFALDRLPAFLAQVTGPVRHVRATRVVDASTRRAALQRKIGAGMTTEAFLEAVEKGGIGHVGLAESAALVAMGCGLEVDEVEEEVDPMIAEEGSDSTAVPVRPGEVAGVHQVVRGFGDGREVVCLDLTIALGAADPRDEVELTCEPPLRLVVPGGTPGESATAWAVVNAATAITDLRGLVTVLDLPVGR
jgi:4-hydroxy-tetrahydrodipicolinate reductase